MDAPTDRGAAGLQQPEFFRPGYGLGAALDGEFAKDVVEMLFDRAEGHNQILRNFLIRIAGRYSPQDFQLALAQGFKQPLWGSSSFTHRLEQVQGIAGVPVLGHRSAQQLDHRRAFIQKDTDKPFRFSQTEGLVQRSQGLFRAMLGSEGDGLQDQNLDQAAVTFSRCGGVVQSEQQALGGLQLALSDQ
jgi:hypothetical protein